MKETKLMALLLVQWSNGLVKRFRVRTLRHKINLTQFYGHLLGEVFQQNPPDLHEVITIQ